MRPLEAGRLFLEALKWYQKPLDHQYSSEEIDLYDASADKLTGRRHFAKEFVATFLPDEYDPGITIEIAAGTGLISESLASRVKASNLYLSDISPAAVRKLRNRMNDRATIDQADFFHLPYKDNFANTLVCVGGYRYVGERVSEFWNEVNRVVAPGGTILVAEFHPLIRRISGIQLQHDVLPDELSLISQTNILSHTDPFSIPSGRYTVSVIKKA
ncbi:MAG: class I SAM-dependent methyltransferase [Candidatus Levyibacteriota bacterium]